MAGFTGMDIEAVKGLSNQMKQKAGEIDAIKNQLTSALNSAQWVGPDQARFKSDWDGQCVQALTKVSQTLNDAAQAAQQNAQQQEQASNT